ncbi:MAG: M48 family metallopeptidase [Deltaproteobacteria bacterium]|nr:M48 family metallopeptidase [Deltaproteobacteria bacterium]
MFNVLIPWSLGLFALLCFGTILSWLTLQYATGATQREKPSTAESILLRSYRALIGISSVYYYLSLPLVLLFVLALCGAVLLGVVLLGVIPIKLVVILGMVVVGSLAAVLKSFWIKTVDLAPGELIDCTHHPVLSKMLYELAQTLQTARPTKIYITQGADAAVYEEGGVWAHLRGKSTRCLIIGLALVEGLTMDELRSILAHEYGHFRNKDTAGGHLALSVRRAMFRTINVLIDHGVGNMSPLWWFTQGYYKLFMRISQGASRLQEILADRTAAQTCGSHVFASALKRSIAQANRFELSVDSVLNDAFEGKYAISNLYAQARIAEIDGSKIEALTTEEIARLPSMYDSHPSPQQRIALVNSLNVAQATQSDTRPASEIFSNGLELQLKMTRTILDSIEARTGKDLSTVAVPEGLPH